MDQYLSDERFILKNKTCITFEESINVFVTLKQTPLATEQYDNPDLEARLNGIKKRFKDACDEFNERKQAQVALKTEDKRCSYTHRSISSL